MEQRLCIKILREKYHKAKEIAEKLVQHFSTEALNYSEVCYWMREFAPDREQVEDARRSGRTLDFICHSRIQPVAEEMLNASARQLAKISYSSPSTVFDVLRFILRVKFRHWKWIPRSRSEDNKRNECRWQNPWKFRWSRCNDGTG
jgi:hypothetical protein